MRHFRERIMVEDRHQKLAATYYRHSAEDKQEFSISVQREEIYKFAKKHHITIIKEFEDAGKSGLSAKRSGFEKLHEFAQKEKFDYVLVFDVTRWGRFQDTDESAYYEVLMKREGKRVIYIDKGFINDEHPLVSSLIKSIDRYMAADYSKKLSEKVFLGSKKIASLGFSVGGTAPYGLRRLLLDANKKPVRILKDGERKSIDNERVTFTLGDEKEVTVIRRIFELFANEKQDKRTIANMLNKEGLRSSKGKLWDVKKIHDILRNENYAGTKVYNKTTKKLKSPSRKNPRDQWVTCKNAFDPIIPQELFSRASEELERMKLRYTTQKLLEELQKIHDKYKRITSDLINNWKDTGCAGTYGRRFVSLYNAYIKVDYMPKMAFNFFKKREQQRFILTGIVKEKLNNVGHAITHKDAFLYINQKKIIIIPSIPRKRKSNNYWTFYFETREIDYALCVGFADKETTNIAKYFLFPKEIVEENFVNINTSNDAKYEMYALKNIENISL